VLEWEKILRNDKKRVYPKKACGHEKGYKCCCNMKEVDPIDAYDQIVKKRGERD